MLATLEAAGLSAITLDLGHVGIYEAVVLRAGLEEAREASVFDCPATQIGARFNTGA